MKRSCKTTNPSRMEILAIGSYQHTFDSDSESTELPDLREELKTLCSQRYRRIDRFIQLCLLGAGRCQKQFRQAYPGAGVQSESQTKIPGDTALYLASGLAAMSNTVKVQEQIFQHRLPPKPAHFINTLSNSAGFYVAKDLGLSGKNLFISRANASFEASLQLAAQDFAATNNRMALIGAVDECLIPLAEHKARLRLASSDKLAEGSHWLLAQRAGEETVAQTKNTELGCIEFIKTVSSIEAFNAWLLNALNNEELQDSALYFHGETGLTAPYADAELPQLPLFDLGKEQAGYYDSRSADAICSFLSMEADSHRMKHLISINADKSGRLHLLKASRYADNN